MSRRTAAFQDDDEEEVDSFPRPPPPPTLTIDMGAFLLRRARARTASFSDAKRTVSLAVVNAYDFRIPDRHTDPAPARIERSWLVTTEAISGYDALEHAGYRPTVERVEDHYEIFVRRRFL